MRPTVAVAICTYTEDRLPQLLAAVDSVRAQTMPPEQLLVVVDHNERLLSLLEGMLPKELVVANAHRRGLSGGRNTAAETVMADVLVFLDDDARARPDWLEHLIAPFAAPRVVATGGHVEADWELPAPGSFPPEFLWTVGCSYRGLPEVECEIRNPFGGNMAIRREAVLRAGLFREDIGRIGAIPLGCEETEMALRLTEGGDTIRLVPAAVIDHLVPVSRAGLGYFLRRCYAEGLSKAFVASLSGAQRTLSSERAYVARALPAGAIRSLVEVVRGPGRVTAAGRLGALLAGLATTAAGYAVGRLRRSAAHQPRPAPAPLG